MLYGSAQKPDHFPLDQNMLREVLNIDPLVSQIFAGILPISLPIQWCPFS